MSAEAFIVPSPADSDGAMLKHGTFDNSTERRATHHSSRSAELQCCFKLWAHNLTCFLKMEIESSLNSISKPFLPCSVDLTAFVLKLNRGRR